MATTLYFVRGEEAGLLAESGVPVRVHSLGNTRGRLFPAAYKDGALAALGWDPAHVTELITCEWGIRELAHSDGAEPLPRENVTLHFHDQPSSAWEEYLGIVRQWCLEHPPAFPVAIHYSAGRHGLYGNGCLHLCFGGSAGYGMRAWRHERDIFYQAAHVWIGELGPEHASCRALIPAILAESVPRMSEGVQQESECEFVAHTVRKAQDRSECLRRDLVAQGETVSKLQVQLRDEIRRYDDIARQLMAAEARIAEVGRHMHDQYSQLARRSYVQGIETAEDTISIVTDNVVAEVTHGAGPPTLYHFGAFRIDLFLDQRIRCVRVTSLTRRGSWLRGFHHPHVDASGVPCLGSIREGLPVFIARGEYVAAFDLLYRLLHVVNTDDAWGRLVSDWPSFSSFHPSGDPRP